MDVAKYEAAERKTWDSLGVTPSQVRVHLKRNDVNVRLQEIGEGPPVLFVHAAMTGGTAWASLAARIRGFRCLLLDRPGAGLSDPLATPPTLESMPRFAETLVVDVLDALELESSHVVASSFGGYFALRGAAADPERIERIVQCSCPVGAPMANRPLGMRLMTVPVLWRLLLLPPNEAAVRRMFRQVGHGASVKAGRITKLDIEGWLALLRHSDTRRNEMAMGRWFFTSQGQERLVLTDDILGKITAPTYFLWGENDPFGGAEVAQHLVDRMPDAQLEIVPGSGHAPWFDCLDHAAETISTFFGG